MQFTDLDILNAKLITTEPVRDERGSFTRLMCRNTFAAHGIDFKIAQISEVHNLKAGTMRGMHYQKPPHEEAKLIQCIRGRVYDVLVDLRQSSPTFQRWTAIELTGDDAHLVYVPPGIAHGYQTLLDDTILQYSIDTDHEPNAAGGVRHDDPAFCIAWPMPVTMMNPRDCSFPDFDPRASVFE